MTPEGHKKSISDRWTKAFNAKYDQGQREHGGNLWEKPTLDAAIEEALDLPAYLYTLRDQLDEAISNLEAATLREGTAEGWRYVYRALSILRTGA